MELNKLGVENISSITKYPAVEALIAVVTSIPSFITRNSYFIFSFTMTLIFYLPALQNGSENAGFLYKGDVLGWYLPALAKTHTLIHLFNFTAIDYSTFNGSSDFFLSPNFFAYHPLVVIYCLLVSPETTNVQQLGSFLVLLMAIHSFLACYFSLKLFTRFFAFEFGAAALIATAFAFSMHMLNALGQPVFLLCASIVPWVAYAALAYAEKPNFRNLIFACLPIIIGFMGGYMPLGVASLALSAILVAAKLLYVDESNMPFDKRIRVLFVALLPFVCASIIVVPYLYSVYKFHQETSSAGIVSLFYSAHQYAQLPQNLLTLFSSHFYVPGPDSEFSILWGFIAICIATIFFLSPKVMDALAPRELKLFKISALIYFATVLATFGDYSVVSDLVFYLVPQVGGMHIYQRFLLPAQLMFAIMLALMLKALIQERPIVATRVAWIILAVATLTVAFLLSFQPVLSREIGLNSYIAIELFIGFLFLCALLVPGKNFIYIAAILLFCLPALNRMYDYSRPEFTLSEQRESKIFALDEGMKKKIVSYFKRYSDKAVIKYVDITPMWKAKTIPALHAAGSVETFPKVFPDFVLMEQKLSSYGGFTFYLSARDDYMRKMPVAGADVAVNPDWEYLINTGADFLVARGADLQNGTLGSLFAKIKIEDVLKLPNDVVIVPLRTLAEKSLSSGAVIFDNGYFKISPTINEANSNLVNIALGKPTRQSSDAGADAKLAVDGNTNGNFSLGSVTHTLRDVNAWLEVDLGATEPIDSVTIWNRTDCCGYCLRDYWLFISDKPFKASDIASDLRVRTDTWSQQNFAPNPKGTIMTGGVRGRYVRVQLPGNTQTLKECFLSLAEVEIFRSNKPQVMASATSSGSASDLKVKKFDTNNASFLYLDLESSAPVTVQYLFWDNPRLKYYLNGKRTTIEKRNGLNFIEVPAGHNTLEIRYKHWPLIAFLTLYIIYALMFMWVMTPASFRAAVWRKLFLGRLHKNGRRF